MNRKVEFTIEGQTYCINVNHIVMIIKNEDGNATIMLSTRVGAYSEVFYTYTPYEDIVKQAFE